MKTIIFGNGLLGGELVRQSGWGSPTRLWGRIEIRKPDSYVEYVKKYDQVINCIGYTNTGDNNKEPHWGVNFKGVIDLVNLCNQYDTKLVHISTDYIYANSVRNAKETDVPVHYDNWYTYTKLLADGYVQAMSNDYLMFRTSFKPRPFPWDAAWSNVEGNFDYVDKIVPLMIELIEKGATGVYNIGTGFKTMLELAQETKPDIKPILSKDIPYDVSMDLTKYETD